jgi:hypothetical protein
LIAKLSDRAARTGKEVQAGYAERVLRTFGMWDCNPVLTPLDPNLRLTKSDSPEAVDPRLHRRMRSIVGCLSYLVNMTRPDLAFAYSQLSKFVQSPGPVHLAAAERALAYLRGTYNEGIVICDLILAVYVAKRRNPYLLINPIFLCMLLEAFFTIPFCSSLFFKIPPRSLNTK